MKELLLKYIKGECSEPEKAEIANWIDADSKNRNEYLALRKLNDIFIWQDNPITKFQQKPDPKKSGLRSNWLTEAMKIAAIFVFAFLAIKFFMPASIGRSEKVAMQTLHVPAGQRAEITLHDGTKVWLNAKSTLIFPSHFSSKKREVKLDGEGFFDVAHNKEMPFVVATEKYNVKVLGTKFNLTAYSRSESFRTSLLEGSVELLQTGHQKGVLLKPNEQAEFKNDKLVICSIEDMDHFLWKDGIISFDDTSFSEMIAQLERYFDLSIELKNTQISDYRYSGKFRMKDGVEHILNVLQLKNNFKYRIDEKLNKIIIE